MNFRFSSEEERFRAEVREFLSDYRELEGFFGQDQKWPEVKAMFQAMGERGWLALAWPEEHGGLGASAVHEYLLWDEAARVRAARPPLSAGIVAKTLARHGTRPQCERWLPPIRRGEIHFSLGYSEPEAGSDLASLRTRAERKRTDRPIPLSVGGDAWRLVGHPGDDSQADVEVGRCRQ